MILFDAQIEVRKDPADPKEKFTPDQIAHIKESLENIGIGPIATNLIQDTIVYTGRITRPSFVGPKSLDTIEIPLPQLRAAIVGAMAGGNTSMTMGDILRLIKEVYDETKDD